jgi:hypothetical protein
VDTDDIVVVAGCNHKGNIFLNYERNASAVVFLHPAKRDTDTIQGSRIAGSPSDPILYAFLQKQLLLRTKRENIRIIYLEDNQNYISNSPLVCIALTTSSILFLSSTAVRCPSSWKDSRYSWDSDTFRVMAVRYTL